MKNRILKVILLLSALSGSALLASAIESKQQTEPAVEVQVDDANGGEEWAAANWVHVGCIQLGSNCYDVFQDPQGDLWVCKACFTTNNPNPGKCRRLTPWEIQNALWCA